MELVALKHLSNGIKEGQAFTEPHKATAELLIAIGAACAASDLQPRLRRRRRRSSSEDATA